MRLRAQNIVFWLADFPGTGWMTSQCSTTFPLSSRKKSARAKPLYTPSGGEIHTIGDYDALRHEAES